MDAYIPAEYRHLVKTPKYGWRRRKVGEIRADGDVEVYDGWGSCRPVDMIGEKVLGRSNEFNDIVFTPRKRPATNPTH